MPLLLPTSPLSSQHQDATPTGMSTPRGHAGAFTKRTWFYTTRLASSLPGCPGSDDEANTIRASRTQRLSTQKKRPSPRPGEEAGPGTSQVDRIEIISLPTPQIPFCERPHRAIGAVFERQQQFCCIRCSLHLPHQAKHKASDRGVHAGLGQSRELSSPRKRVFPSIACDRA